MHDDFVTPAQWLAWFNSERTALIISAARSGWVIGPLTKTSVAATDVYNHPSEIFAVVGVWEQSSTGRLRPINVTNLIDNFRQADGGPVTGPAMDVSVEESAAGLPIFRFYPRPTSGTYIVVTMGATTPKTALSDTFVLPMGTEERIVLGLARRALAKEESDTTEILGQIKTEDRRIEEIAASKIFSAAPRIRNVDRQELGFQRDIEFALIYPDSWLWM